MKKFSYIPLENVGDMQEAETIEKYPIFGYKAIRTQIGDVIEDIRGEEIYRVVSYSEGTETANAVRVTRPETINRLKRQISLTELISDENAWIRGDLSDEEFDVSCDARRQRVCN